MYNSIPTEEKSIIDRLISQLESLQDDLATVTATNRSGILIPLLFTI